MTIISEMSAEKLVVVMSCVMLDVRSDTLAKAAVRADSVCACDDGESGGGDSRLKTKVLGSSDPRKITQIKVNFWLHQRRLVEIISKYSECKFHG